MLLTCHKSGLTKSRVLRQSLEQITETFTSYFKPPCELPLPLPGLWNGLSWGSSPVCPQGGCPFPSPPPRCALRPAHSKLSGVPPAALLRPQPSLTSLLLIHYHLPPLSLPASLMGSHMLLSSQETDISSSLPATFIDLLSPASPHHTVLGGAEQEEWLQQLWAWQQQQLWQETSPWQLSHLPGPIQHSSINFCGYHFMSGHETKFPLEIQVNFNEVPINILTVKNMGIQRHKVTEYVQLPNS